MQEEMKDVKEEIGNKYVTLCVEIIIIAIVMTVLSSLLSWRYGRKVCRSLGKITMKVRKAHSFRGGMKALFILILKCIFMLILYTFYDIL